MPAKKTKSANPVQHLSYPNPTIVEALCEIHFQPPEGASWKPSLPGELFKQIQQEFPEMEPVLEVGVQLELGPAKFGQALLPPRQRMRYKHASRPLLLQLAENLFTVNVLPKYPGWQTMRQDVRDTWSQAKQVLKPAYITRVGLRYINRIERSKSNEEPGEWLHAGDFIPAGILTSEGSFLSRVESHIKKHNRLIVTVAEILTEDPTAARPIVFDIDRILENQRLVDDDILLKEIDALHEHVWQVFAWAQTPRLAKLLTGGGK
jgi:uncharacterized protein (TIGR04255 family)